MYSKPFFGNYPITSHFGNRPPITVNGELTSSFHDGVDFAMPENTPVFNVNGGVVVFAGKDQYGGLYVDIVADSDGRMSRCLHLNRIDVKFGEKVATGQQIGLSGNTGLSTAPHLHFGLFNRDTRKGGKPVDPSQLFDKWLDPDKTNPNSINLINIMFQKKVEEARLLPEFNQAPVDVQEALNSNENIFDPVRMVKFSITQDQAIKQLQTQIELSKQEVEKYSFHKAAVGMGKLNIDKAGVLSVVTIALAFLSNLSGVLPPEQVATWGGFLSSAIIVLGALKQTLSQK